MVITNELINQSFSYAHSGKALTCRLDELTDLDEILDFCKKNDEMVCYDENLMDVEVEDGILLRDILCECVNGKSVDGTVFLREMISKKCKSKQTDPEELILCSCGYFEDAVGTLRDYAKQRQVYLRNMKNHKEYGEFMITCFPNSVFADDCAKEMAYIKSFRKHVDEITDCLSLLDEKAVILYNKYRTNLALAQKILQAELKRTCAPDANHKEQLKFQFSYEEERNGKIHKCAKMIECQPHFKLIRDDSDLRVYFWWKDDEVGNGEKVLIGSVGRHGWKK